jgi:esterase/lipase
MAKHFFLVPGFKQKPTDREFLWLKKFLQAKGFRVTIVPVDWNFHVMSDYVRDFKKFYHTHKSGNDYVLGFSYGAVITFLTAQELKPKKIYLCSLSPDFREDLRVMSPWMRRLTGRKRRLDAKKRSGRAIAKNLSVPSAVFYGEVEGKRYPQLKRRCEETVRLAKHSALVVVSNAPHRIDHPNYIEALKKEFRNL